MALLPAIGIGVGVLSKVLGSSARADAEKARAAALEQNALIRLTSVLSGLQSRERQQLASAAQQRRLGKRQSAVLAARARALGADAGTGSSEQVQDVAVGQAEFLGALDAQLGLVRGELARSRRQARIEFEGARSAARAGVGGPLAQFLDFANIALGTIDAIGNLPKSKSSESSLNNGG